jgi:hypothetical protein
MSCFASPAPEPKMVSWPGIIVSSDRCDDTQRQKTEAEQRYGSIGPTMLRLICARMQLFGD